MSERANPTAIGTFLVGAVAIAAIGLAVLASASWFEKRSTFVSFFSESVNGLESGAPVKFQGVPVGTVSDLTIQIDRTDKTFQVPVRFTIDLTKLRTVSGTFVNLADADVRRTQIAHGLRVQLQMESLVTGQLYLEISYDTSAAAPVLEPRATEWPELPTTPSLMAALGTGAGSVVADVVKVLFQVNALLAEIDMPEINAAVVATAQSVQSLANSPELRSALRQMPAVTTQVTRTMVAIERLAVSSEAAVGPLGEQTALISTELASAMRLLKQTLEQTQGLLSMDTGIGFALQPALVSLKEAADALQLLTTTLEQNPDILLRGRKPPVRTP
jgi:paraquat-inducible protein B